MNVELRDIAKSLQHMDRQMADIVKLQKLIVQKLTNKETNDEKKEKEVSEET